MYVHVLITKSGLPLHKAAEHFFFHCFQSFETFTCITHKVIARKITNSNVVDICFSNKRKICLDPLAADRVKTFSKRKRENSLY